MFHSADSILAALDADEARQKATGSKHPVGRVVIDLEDGDSAWHPASTKHDLHGPFRITYFRFADGAVEASTSPLGKHRSNHWSPPAIDFADGSRVVLEG